MHTSTFSVLFQFVTASLSELQIPVTDKNHKVELRLLSFFEFLMRSMYVHMNYIEIYALCLSHEHF